MGSSLGPILANIIMTELEKVILPKLIEEGLIKFYIRYVDDTFVMIKDEHIDEVMKKFNSFDKNLKFTVDKFQDGIIHFLDILIHAPVEMLKTKSISFQTVITTHTFVKNMQN